MSRIGLLMRKVGCTSIFVDNFLCKAATVLYLEESCIVSIKEEGNFGLICVGYGNVSENKLNKAQRCLYSGVGISCKRKLKQFKVDKRFLDSFGVSQNISVDHFNVGQYVDVVGRSIGKGFAGVMKRHNFKGLAKTHGVSISHRSHGSTGQCQDPGRVFKGKKMAGHLGNKRVTIQNLQIADVDLDKRLIVVYGAVPGPKKGYVLLRDARKKDII